MKTFLKTLLLSVALALALVPPAFAQTATTKTYLSSALAGGAQNKVVSLGSVTGITASTSSNQFFGYIDGEEVTIRSVNTTANTVTVDRAAKGLAVPHPANEIFWYGGPATFNSTNGNVGGAGVTNPVTGGTAIPAVFVNTTPYGTCVRASNTYLPVINPSTGEIADCLLSGTATTDEWVIFNPRQSDTALPYRKMKGTNCTSGDLCNSLTLSPIDHTIGTLTTGATTFTIPALTGWRGKEYKIQQETSGAGTISIVTSSGQLINGASSIVISSSNVYSTGFKGVTIYSNGQDWFTPVPPGN